MDSFEERILSYLRENRGTSYTVFQIANYTGTSGAGFIQGKSGGFAVGVQLIRNALENLVGEGYVAKQVSNRSMAEDIYHYAK